MDLRQALKTGSLIGLSPMDGVTDEPFRLTQVHVAKPDLIFTEFVSAEGLAHAGVKLYNQLLYVPVERPVIAQLFGKDPDSFYQAALILCHLGFDGIDINMGCPAKKVTQHGSGAALIEKPELASEIIHAVQSAVSDYHLSKTNITSLKLKEKILELINRNLQKSKLISDISQYPTISVKTRLGISHDTSSSWIPFLLKHNLDFITLHGRTLTQGYGGTANWSSIKQAAVLAHEAGVPLLGNGDIKSRQQGLTACKNFGVDGVLIGRAAMGNPWVFSDKIADYPERFQIMTYHLNQFVSVFPLRRLDSLRRHFLLYTHGHPRAKQLRQKLCQISQIDQLLSLEDSFTH